MPASHESSGLVLIGAGPAGLAPFFAAATTGKLHLLLERGVTVLERGTEPGSGALPTYAIRSDSAAEAFLDIVLRSTEPRLRALLEHPLTQQIRHLERAAVPLPLAGDFLALAGRTLCDLIASTPRGRVLFGAEATALRRLPDGRWCTQYRLRASSLFREITSPSVILSLGAEQPEERLYTNAVAGKPLLPLYRSKLMQSGEVLSHGGLEKVAQTLRGIPQPKVAIVGGSTSAGATAVHLLAEASPLRFGERSLTILHRKPLHIFYEDVQQARLDGYHEFQAQDVCRLSGRVFRFSGFRLDSRELIMAARGIGGGRPEPRLRLLRLSPDHKEQARKVLEEADLIVAALGYTPRTLPVFDEDGDPVALKIPNPSQWAIVDQRCTLLTKKGRPLEGLFALGLAVGPQPGPELGGEAHFGGQVNSLWMWQHTLGGRIVDAILQEGPPIQVSYPKKTLTEAVVSFVPCETDHRNISSMHMGGVQ